MIRINAIRFMGQPPLSIESPNLSLRVSAAIQVAVGSMAVAEINHFGNCLVAHIHPFGTPGMESAAGRRVGGRGDVAEHPRRGEESATMATLRAQIGRASGSERVKI